MIEIVVRVVLAGVLGGAAVAKLLSPRTSEAALATFGFGEGIVRRGAWITLIVTELALAFAVALGSDPAAFGAAALLALFAALVASALMRGRAGAPCACFGARSTIGPLSILRNLALAAGFAAIPFLPSGEGSTDAWLGLGLAVALAACAGLAIAVLALAREVGMLRLQLGTQGALEIAGEGPAVGTQAPQLSGRLAFEGHAELGLAVFTSEGCHLCQTLAPAIENVARDPLVSVAVFDEAAEPDLWRSLAVPGSPFAVTVGRDATVLAKGTFNNLAQLESVLATADRRRREGTPEAADSGLGGLPIGA
ncbi:hypothetical protein BH20ACT15_BH20ACT15_13740 [soil metagenome]